MMTKRVCGICLGGALVFVLGLTTGTAAKADQYPCDTIRWIVPYSPGGGVDWLTRLVAEPLPKLLGGTMVVVENRGGASGAIGAKALKASPADGCHVMSMSFSMVVTQALLGKERAGYDLLNEYDPVINMVGTPYFITANASLKVKSIPELIEAAKKSPGTIPYSTSGTAGNQTVVYNMIQSMANIKMVEVPYKGGGDMFADFLSGRVPLFLAFPYEVKAYVDEGKAYYLAVTSLKRHPRYPDIPAVSEALPGYNLMQSYGVLAPVGTPKQLVTQLNEAIAKSLNSDAVKSKLESETSHMVDGDTPESFGKLLIDTLASYEEVAKKMKK